MNNELTNIEQNQENSVEPDNAELNETNPTDEAQQQEIFPVAETTEETTILTSEPEAPAQDIPDEPVIMADVAASEEAELVETDTEPILETVTEPIVETVAETISDEPVLETAEVETAVEPIVEELKSEPVAEIEVVKQSVESPEVVVAVEDTPASIVVQSETPTPESVPVQSVPEHDAKEAARQEKAHWQEKFEQIYKELVQIKDNNETIEVEIKGRIRGGLRALYKDMPLFLPASHYSLKRTPTEQELTEATGKRLLVHVHELQEYDEGRKAVIVSRKHLLTEDFWTRINVGDIVEGKVSSIASFGVFVDLGGVEGLIHISRLSQVHVDDPNKFIKKGETVKAVVVELDKDKNRIALSRKELEESPWKDIETTFAVGSQHTGTVRRLTDFGVYVELKPGVDGLLRTPEISWTKRIKRPSDVLKAGMDIQVEILSVSEEKQTVSLSYKKTQPNPWPLLVDKYPVGTVYPGIVSQVMPQGCIIAINEDVDGFMPRSKMKSILAGNKIPFHPGENVNVMIADLIPEEESLILAPVVDEDSNKPQEQKKNQQSNNDNAKAKAAQQAGISFVDMLSESQKKNLFDTVD